MAVAVRSHVEPQMPWSSFPTMAERRISTNTTVFLTASTLYLPSLVASVPLKADLEAVSRVPSLKPSSFLSLSVGYSSPRLSFHVRVPTVNVTLSTGFAYLSPRPCTVILSPPPLSTSLPPCFPIPSLPPPFWCALLFSFFFFFYFVIFWCYCYFIF